MQKKVWLATLLVAATTAFAAMAPPAMADILRIEDASEVNPDLTCFLELPDGYAEGDRVQIEWGTTDGEKIGIRPVPEEYKGADVLPPSGIGTVTIGDPDDGVRVWVLDVDSNPAECAHRITTRPEGPLVLGGDGGGGGPPACDPRKEECPTEPPCDPKKDKDCCPPERTSGTHPGCEEPPEECPPGKVGTPPHCEEPPCDPKKDECECPDEMRTSGGNDPGCEEPPEECPKGHGLLGGGDDCPKPPKECKYGGIYPDCNDKPKKGNEGVGNGEDPPPPGHDENQNDGPGTSPGNPGSQGGNKEEKEKKEKESVLDLIL